MQILSKHVYIWLSAQGPVWPIADNICFDCKVNGGWPRPLLTYYEVNKILLLLLLHIFLIKNDWLFSSLIKCCTSWWTRKKNPLYMWGWDRKICPSWSALVITLHHSWCQLVILRTGFSIPPSHSWWILINLDQFGPNKRSQCQLIGNFMYPLWSVFW